MHATAALNPRPFLPMLGEKEGRGSDAAWNEVPTTIQFVCGGVVRDGAGNDVWEKRNGPVPQGLACAVRTENYGAREGARVAGFGTGSILSVPSFCENRKRFIENY